MKREFFPKYLISPVLLVGLFLLQGTSFAFDGIIHEPEIEISDVENDYESNNYKSEHMDRILPGDGHRYNSI